MKQVNLTAQISKSGNIRMFSTVKLGNDSFDIAASQLLHKINGGLGLHYCIRCANKRPDFHVTQSGKSRFGYTQASVARRNAMEYLRVRNCDIPYTNAAYAKAGQIDVAVVDLIFLRCFLNCSSRCPEAIQKHRFDFYRKRCFA